MFDQHVCRFESYPATPKRGIVMFNIFRKKHEEVKECDHTYFPHRNNSSIMIGQKCSICGHFNSLEAMEYSKEMIEFIKTKM